VRPDREKERKDAIRRDMILAGVAVVAFVGLGALLTFLSGDAARLVQSLRGLFMDGPPQITAQPPKPVRQAEISGCKYCATLKKIHHDFEAKAKAARELQDAAQKAASPDAQDVPAGGQLEGASRAELAAASDSFERFAAAASALQPYVAACEQESFCRADYAVAPADETCPETADDAALREPAAGMAAVAREAALACIAQACPAIDCAVAGGLRQDLINSAQAMALVGEPVAAAKGHPKPADLPVGAATLSGEIARAIKDVEYAAQNYPSLIERPGQSAQSKNQQQPSMAQDLAVRQPDILRSIADVMVQAAVVTPFARDPRREAAWRMKSLALSIAEAGRMSDRELLNGADGKAYRVALSQNWGAALVDLAALSAMADRMKAAKVSAAGCNGLTAAAAQSARDAAALLDICRARAACPVGAGPNAATALKTSADARAALVELIPRAQSAGDVLNASISRESGAAPSGNELAQAAVVLNAGGVCQAGQPAQ
jgi:hypothetical protein